MTKIKSIIKAHLFLCVIVLLYVLIAPFSAATSVEGLKNSVYYIKEMLMIMPPVFVLTALLDTWIPRETIIKYMGPGSGAKGIILSFILGSVAAGPIYAAFPVCVMLRKKDASIRNITIILSAWAVVKIPMLLNETKFLGLRFMLTRWVLTVAAILVFSWITSKIVKDNEMILRGSEKDAGPRVNRNSCIGCGMCTRRCPNVFIMDNGKADIKQGADLSDKALHEAISACPVKAISP